VCHRARRRITSRHVPAHVGDLGVPAVFPVGRAEGPSSAMPRPNSACSRRRHRRFTNIYSFPWPWRSMTVQSAARLRRTVGPLASRNAVAGQTGQRDIIGHRPSSPGIFRAYSGHIRTRRESSRAVSPVAGHAVPSGSSRAVSPVAGSRPVRLVACGIARRRIASRQARRVRYRPSPDTASRMVVACRMARRPITSRRVPARCGDLGVPAVPPVGHPEGPSSAMPRPNSACSRRRQRRCTNIYSFVWPWRSMTVQSAARLRRTVGPLPPIGRVANRRAAEPIPDIPGSRAALRKKTITVVPYICCLYT